MQKQLNGTGHWFRLAQTGHAFVLDCLGHDIVSGRLPTGSLMPSDAKLTERFKVSRTVLREVMKTLAAKGLIVAKARIGTRITEPSAWNMFDRDILRWHIIGTFDPVFINQIFDIRLALEPVAAVLATRHARPEQIEYLFDCVERLNEFGNAKEEFVRNVLDFHLGILEASQNPFLRSIGNVVEASLVLLFRTGPNPTEKVELQDIVKSCFHIAETIRQGSQVSVRGAVLTHIKTWRGYCFV